MRLPDRKIQGAGFSMKLEIAEPTIDDGLDWLGLLGAQGARLKKRASRYRNSIGRLATMLTADEPRSVWSFLDGVDGLRAEFIINTDCKPGTAMTYTQSARRGLQVFLEHRDRPLEEAAKLIADEVNGRTLNGSAPLRSLPLECGGVFEFRSPGELSLNDVRLAVVSVATLASDLEGVRSILNAATDHQ